MLTPELKLLAEEGCAIHIGSTSASGEPDAVRGFSVLVEPDDRTLRIGLCGGWMEPLLTNVREQPRVSVTVSRLATFESFQLKGAFVGVEEPNEEDHARVARYARAFVHGGLAIGIPESLHRLRVEAERMLRVRVDVVRRQTPGPGAGETIHEASS